VEAARASVSFLRLFLAPISFDVQFQYSSVFFLLHSLYFSPNKQTVTLPMLKTLPFLKKNAGLKQLILSPLAPDKRKIKVKIKMKSVFFRFLLID
jgi:hypothetical protein